MAANIGSVFLGDHARLSRHFSNSTSTPPSSPPPTGMATSHSGARASTSPLAKQAFEDLDLDDATDAPEASTSQPRTASNTILNVDLNALPPAGPRKPIDPQLALELRVRWLEAIVCGLPTVSSSGNTKRGIVNRGKGKEKADTSRTRTETLVRLAENVQRELEAAVEGNEGLKKFMDHCACAIPFLTEIHSHSMCTG